MRRALPLGAQLYLLLLVVIVPFLGTLAYQYWHDVALAREDAGERLRLVARAVAAEVDSDLAQAQALLAPLARRPLVRAVDPARCDPFLEEFARLRPDWSNVGVVDLAGRLVCSVRPYDGDELYAIADRSLFFDQSLRTGRPVISRPFLGPLSKRWVIVMAQPIRDDAGTVRGLLVVAPELAKLRLPRAGLANDKGDSFDVFDASGNVIMRSAGAGQWIGKSLAGASPAVDAIRAEAAADGVLSATDADGVRGEYGYATVAHSGWRVAVGRPLARVDAQANANGRRRALLGLLVAAATLLGGLLLAARMRRSIGRVTDAVDAIRRGDFKVRLPLEGPAEIERLAAGFNRMLDIRIRAASGLRKANRTLGMLSECNKALVRAQSEQELLERMCRIAVDLGGYSLAWVGYAEDGPDKRVREVAHAGPDGGYLSGIEVTWGDRDTGRGPCGRAIREREAVIVRDTGADPAFAPWKESASTYEFKTCACFPLVAAGQAIGALNLYSREADAFGEEDAGLLRDLADDLGYGIHALRAQADRARMLAEQGILLDSAAVGIAFIKEDRVVHSNRGYAAMFGYGRDEIAGVPTRELHVSYDAFDAAAAQVQSRVAESGRYAGERQYRRRDGGLFWVSYEITPLDSTDLDRGVIWTGYDITKAKQVETALRESEERLRLTLEATQVGIWDWDMRSGEWHANPTYFTMLGYEPDPGPQSRAIWGPRRHPEDRDLVHDALDAVRGLGRNFDVEVRVRHADGSYRWVINTGCTVAYDDAGRARRMLGLQIDITERKQAQLALTQSEELLRELTANIPEGYWVRDAASGELLYIGPAWERLTGAAPPVGASYEKLFEAIHPEDRARMQRAVAAAPLGGVDAECRMLHADGSVRWVRSRTFPIRNSVGEVYRVGGIAEDITERKAAIEALARSEELLRQLAGNIPEAFWVREADSERILYASPGWQAITGGPALSSLQDIWKIVHPDDRERVRAEARAASAGGVDHEYRFTRADGELRWLRVRSFPIRDAGGDSRRVAVVAEDVTEKKAGEQRLLQLAHYDHLTDLPNRAYFSEALERTLAQARRNQWVVGVLFIDLDRFKGVNDTLGHAAGDELLQQVANRLLQCVRLRDVVGRLGGDEYALLLPSLEQPEHAGSVAAKILESFTRPFEIGGRELFVTPSIGIATFPADGDQAGELLRNADAAMYRAKEVGRNTYRYYTGQMNRLAAEKLELEGLLRHALERGEFVLHYQPKLELASGRVSGLEALLRWQRPDVGLVSPATFIPLLEETGLIVPVGDWVVAEACRQLKAWQAEGAAPVPIAVNLSARQFREKDLAARIERAAREHALAPGELELEITESALMSNDADVVAALDALRAAGMGIALDDFGTGYSSLSYLKRFPFSAVKIDQSFVSGVMTDPNDAAIALSVIGIGRSLGLRVTAEGVETKEQLEFLRANRCDEIQGYHFARPMDAAATAEFLRRHRGR